MKALSAALLAVILGACTGADSTPTPAATFVPAPTLPPPASGTPSSVPTPTSTPEAGRTPRPAPNDSQLSPALQSVLDEWLEVSDTPGAVLGVSLADGRAAVVASGWRDTAADEPVEPTDRFRIGSITKTFVAALILDLADDGLVELDAPLSTYLPDAPHAGQVTIHQLLAHTSGMPDFFLLEEYQTAIFIAPGRVWDPVDVLGLGDDPALDFEPGTRWAYSNTGYLLLGLVAEDVTGDPLAALVRERISEPLGLSDTYLDELEPAPAVPAAGHHDIDGDGVHDSLTGIPYTALITSGAAAGGLSSTALDVLDFCGGLFSGGLLTEDALARMLQSTPHNSAYGLGIARFNDQAWGHAGALPGFTTAFARSDDEGDSMVVLSNRSGANVDSLVRTVAALLAEEDG